MATTVSKQFSLNLSDWWKGLLMAVIVPVIAIISDSISKGVLTFNWHLILIAALGGGLGYLTKNLLTPTKVTVTGVSDATIKQIDAGTTEMKPMTK